MARSVRVKVALVAIALPLAGCTTTQHEAQRLQLDAARQRVALERTRVRVPNRHVFPTQIGFVCSRTQTAIVVTVRNSGRRRVSDLPISVGYATRGGRVYLNSGANRGYFDAHLPSIAAGHSLTWVYDAVAHLPQRSRVFAVIGRRPSAPAQLTETYVRIGLRYADRPTSSSVNIHLHNPTDVPQYELQVYAYARVGRRYTAAGSATVAELGGGAERALRLRLVGSAPTRGLRIEAVPTILQ